MAQHDSFISYRRSTSSFVARAVFQDLRAHGIDAFLDVEAIGGGAFRTTIEHEIRRRPYFLPVFTPTALERCSEPDDVLRHEVEWAMQSERNAVPLVTEGFDRQEISRFLPAPLSNYYASLNTVNIDHEYFEAAMTKLRERFLNVPRGAAEATPSTSPATTQTKDAERLMRAAAALPVVSARSLRAQKHFERAMAVAGDDDGLAAEEFRKGSVLLAQSDLAELRSLKADYDLTVMELQLRMQAEVRRAAVLSKILEAQHEVAKKAIASIR